MVARVQFIKIRLAWVNSKTES